MSLRGLVDPFGSAPQKEGGRSDVLTKVFIPLSSTLVGVVGLLVGQQKLPHWVFLVGGGYLVVAIATLLFSPAKRLVLNLIARWKQCVMTRRHHPELLRIRGELWPMLDRNYSNTLRALLVEVSAWNDVPGRPVFEGDHAETLCGWLTSVGKRLDRGGCDFIRCASDMSFILHQLNRMYVMKHQELETLIAGGKLPGHRLTYLKREWNLRRERHVALVRDWTGVAKAVNLWAGPDVCGEHYQDLPPLE